MTINIHTLIIYPPVLVFTAMCWNPDTHAYDLDLSPELTCPSCFCRMWIWGKRWMRAPASRGLTATTSTWPSLTTTWIRPSRRYRQPWINCAVNPSGSQWTGYTEDQHHSLHCPVYVGLSDPPTCMRVCVRVLVITKAKEDEGQRYYCK